jgi:predicted nuclease of predicted toxin-antitoxin system
MKFIIDQPVSPRLAEWLRSADAGSHDAVHVRERGMSKARDAELVEVARDEGRVLVTSDLDFARLLALAGMRSPGLILFRAGNVSDREMLALLRRVLESVSAELLVCSAVVVDEHTIRVASLPSGRRTDRGMFGPDAGE